MAKQKKAIRTEDIFTDEESVHFIRTVRKLINQGNCKTAYKMAVDYKRKYPQSILYAYYEAVLTAEETSGYTPQQIKVRQRQAALKLKKILHRLRGIHPWFVASVRNEYYWFSRQPRKQYQLGVEMVAKGRRGSYYSQGVGSAELARLYALAGKKKLCLRWAKISEQAWLNFFKVDSNWSNSYFFYAAALAFQGRLKEMDKAFAKSAKIAGKTMRWREIQDWRKEVLEAVAVLDGSRAKAKGS